MRVSVSFQRAPPVMAWLTVLTERGWQVVRHDVDLLRARRQVGASEHPIRLATTWYVMVRENGEEGVDIVIEVPAFTESSYAEQRLLNTIEEWRGAVDGACETDNTFSLDILGTLTDP